MTQAKYYSVPMQIQDLAKSYQTKTDEELVQLAINLEQLTAEARSVLMGELTRRRIDVTENLGAARKLGDHFACVLCFSSDCYRCLDRDRWF